MFVTTLAAYVANLWALYKMSFSTQTVADTGPQCRCTLTSFPENLDFYSASVSQWTLQSEHSWMCHHQALSRKDSNNISKKTLIHLSPNKTTCNAVLYIKAQETNISITD